MPILQYDGHLDGPRLSPRPVVAGRTDVEAGPGGMGLAAHQHPMAQMIYVARGLLTCEVARGLWIVPPRCAIWIPGGAWHDVKGVGTLEVYSLFVDPASAPTMPVACGTVAVSPLLRELLLRCAGFAGLTPADGPESRLAAVLLDELAAAPVENLHLPMPADERLRRIADGMAADPADRAGVPEWAGRVGVGERTLSRLVRRETGMSFGRWRQQLHIMLALQWLSRGSTVQKVAAGLGYESASSFVVMFRKALGSSPARYVASRGAGPPGPAGRDLG